MTYIYSESTLLTFSIPQLKETALAQGVTVASYPNRKISWVAAILTRQAFLVPVPVADAEELIIDDAPVVATDDRTICQELGLELINPYPSAKGRIEPSGSIVAEVEQDGRYLGAIRRYYTAVGIFYTPNCRWTGLEYPTAHAAALSMISDSDVEIAKATVERDMNDKYITEFMAPLTKPPLPTNNFQVAPIVPRDQTDANRLDRLTKDGGQLLTVFSDGVLCGASISAGQVSTIGEIEVDKDGRCKIGVRGGSFYEQSLIADNLELAIAALKTRWVDRNLDPNHRQLWSDYIGHELDVKSRPEWMFALL
jgi:hypothetical protein